MIYYTKHEQSDGYCVPLWYIYTADAKTDTDTDKMGTQNPMEFGVYLSLWAAWKLPHNSIQAIFIAISVWQCKHTISRAPPQQLPRL